MAHSMQGKTVVRDDGVRGSVVDFIAAKDGVKAKLIVEFADGVRVAVPEKTLVLQADGTYRLAVGAGKLFAAGAQRTGEAAVAAATSVAAPEVAAAEYETTEGELVIPVIAEEVVIEKELVTRGAVRAHKRVETYDEVVDVPITREEVIVERLAINTLVDDLVPSIREVNGVLIIPVVEEILVVEKRLLLREEVRLSKRLTTTSVPQKVTLRREVVDIERVDASGNPAEGTDATADGTTAAVEE
jgi:uncharacterized protein (TIGR02271 family)